MWPSSSLALDVSAEVAAALKAVGASVKYTELPGVGHNSWDSAYNNANLMTWLFTQRK